MKRIISVLVCICMAAGFVLPASAAPFETEEVMFSRCDIRANWSKYAPNSYNVVEDSENYTEYPNSVKMINDLKNDKILVAICTPYEAADAGENDRLSFDMYVEDTSIFENANGQIELSSSGTSDVDEINWGAASLYSKLKPGWNTVTLNFSSAGHTDTDGGDGFNKHAINYFRLYIVNVVSDKTDYVINFDNVRFTSGLSYAKEEQKAEYKKPQGVEAKDEIITYGDIDNSGTIDASDALCVLQYSVGKIYFNEKQLTVSDVDGSGEIAAADALCVLQRSVGKKEGFDVNGVIAANDYMSQINIPGTRRVTPCYESSETVIAAADVVYFGAAGDGVTDDTLAFERAIGYVDSLGGGTLFVPVGQYVITRTISIPDSVTLRGDAPEKPEKGAVEGTVLLAYVGRNDPDGHPFIYINGSSVVRNLAIYYPEQTPDNIVPYSYTIKESAQHGPALESLVLVNSYQGIKFGPYLNALQHVRNVCVTALKTGYFIDHTVDTCIIEDFRFSPDYWIESGLYEKMDDAAADAVRAYSKQNCTALIIEQVDWTYFTDVFIDGCNIGMLLRETSERDEKGTPNGQIFNFSITDCVTGIYGEVINPIGHIFTNGLVEADLPVYLPETSIYNSTYGNVTFRSLKESCVLIEAGDAAFTDCRFETAGGNSVGVVTENDAEVSFANCSFEGGASDIEVSRGAWVQAVNCNTEDALRISGATLRAKTAWDNEYTTKTVDSEAYDYSRAVSFRPLGSAFVDITSKEYGVVSGKVSDTDISAVLQKAVDDVAEMGGGTVYIPAGTYLVNSPIRVKRGVEILGPSTTLHHTVCPSAVIYTDFGRGKTAEDEALFTLESQSGISGFKIYYYDFDCPANGEPSDVYSYTVRGDGYNVRINNITLLNAYYGVDLFTNRCDGHYVDCLAGTPIATGIRTGGGSVGGEVRDVQFNQHYAGGYCYNVGADIDGIYNYNRDFTESIVIGDTVNEIYYNNFMLGALTGLLIIESPENAFILGHGSDGANYSMTARGENKYPVTLVNSQFVCVGGARSMEYINEEPDFKGKLIFIQTNMWGQPTNASNIYDNTELYGGTLLRCGNEGMQVNAGTLVMAGMVSWQPDVKHDVVMGEKSVSALVFGNVLESNGVFSDPDGKIKGSDTVPFNTEAMPEAVTFNLCNRLNGWTRYAPDGDNITLDPVYKTEGFSSVVFIFDTVKNPFVSVSCKLPEAVSMGENDRFEFDIFLEDASAFEGKTPLVELTSGGECDVAEVSWYLSRMVDGGLKDGWNHAVFNVKSGIYFSKDETKAFNPESVNFFRLFCADVSGEDSDYYIRIDNMKFTATVGNK